MSAREGMAWLCGTPRGTDGASRLAMRSATAYVAGTALASALAGVVEPQAGEGLGYPLGSRHALGVLPCH
jgi:hypothetical protein